VSCNRKRVPGRVPARARLTGCKQREASEVEPVRGHTEREVEGMRHAGCQKDAQAWIGFTLSFITGGDARVEPINTPPAKYAPESESGRMS
jgi:hypothetical protein